MAQMENKRILVIDDEPSMHQDFASVLTAPARAAADTRFDALEAAMFDADPAPVRRGFSMVSAHQGREGLDLSRAAVESGQPFSVAFVDMRMPPGWDGLQTVKALWEFDPRLQFVLCSAYSPHAWEDALQQLQAHDQLLVIKKPFDPIEVWQAAATLSAKWAFEREAEAAIAMLEPPLSPPPPAARP